jgi:hypothetical protein
MTRLLLGAELLISVDGFFSYFAATGCKCTSYGMRPNNEERTLFFGLNPSLLSIVFHECSSDQLSDVDFRCVMLYEYYAAANRIGHVYISSTPNSI